MPTIVDSLIVTLGLDPKAFEKGAEQAGNAQDKLEKKTRSSNKRMSEEEKKLEEERKRREKAIEDRTKAITSALQKARNEAIAFFSALAIGSGLKSFIENTISSASSLDRLSSNLNMSAKDISEWQLAAKHAGGTVEGMTAQLKQSADDVAKFKMGMSSDSLQWFFREGGSTDALKDTNSLLRAKADIIKKIFDVDPNRARLVASLMGVSDEGSFNLMKHGAVEMERQRQAQAKLAEEMARASKPAEALRKKFDTLKNTFESISVRVLTALMPAFDKLMKYFQQLGDWVVAHKDDISRWVDEAVDAIKSFAKEADAAAESVGGWKNILLALLALKVLSFTGNLLGLAGALTNVGSALGGIGKLGPAALVALAGLAGYGIGTAIYDKAISGTDIGDVIGEIVARTLASFGNKDAQDSIRRMTGKDDYGTLTPQIVQQLMKSGWTREQASGIAANFFQESRNDPHGVGDNGAAYGIGQWHPDRQAAFKKRFGKDIRASSLEEQVAFADFELRQGSEKSAGDLLAKAKTASEAGAIVSRYYERPKDADLQASIRANNAAGISDQIASMNAMAAAGLPARASARPVAGAPSSNVSSETHINTINIQTAATDAAGIAKTIPAAVQRYSFASQANTGLN